ncbi:MAG: DinB family protein [Flavobacterium sp.]|nr:MAG: DinB family protein [Flavobacterium sp.]
MKFSLTRSLEVLRNSPNVLSALLFNLSAVWTENNEGENSWTAKEVLAHLIVCEETNWLPRIRIILSNQPNKILSSIDMAAHSILAKGSSIQDLIKRFSQLRESGIEELLAYDLDENDFEKTADHPEIGKINIQQLISTWVAHDLTHIAQIARIMARQTKGNVGSFEKYLKILN